ncbi:sn-glycerol-3-phosphate ABC transporter ATP-binding protein UgpC [Paracoccus caeni]|uniref:Sn-glycerol-3-phosphate ABC transporter ATP-binding protein UgpC n=1 Tax=Paracoccus caeni TaxID=657651 RepID=A0A934VYC7_9RHOB|nr:sn-glycerol-3-phosphate ABC transporter ATP-binding protein UgpC [Paracoccus caeni]MBK4214605.1 sn-glycerol-3-phosphate ABC transporter ATP-binding protein UgpC [Paracoccus caeni]
MGAVAFRKLSKAYGQAPIVQAIDLDIADGEFVVLVGPSGSGKSTILRMLAGLESVTGGEVLIGGQVVNHLQPRQRDIAMVFQDYALYPHKSVRENLGFSLKVRGVDRAEAERRIGEAAEMLGIGHLLDRRPAELSGGQRQRVAMGRAIVRRPQVFLFDEPLSNLDAKLRGQVRTEIKKLHQMLGTTILYVTHDQVEAMTLADRIVILRGGVIEQVGTPDQVYGNPANVFVGGFIGAPAMNFLRCSVRDGVVDYAGQVLLTGRDDLPDQVLLGLRPEHLAAGRGQGIDLSGVVQVVEPLGADTLVHVDLGGALVTARLDPALRPQPGSRIDLTAAFANIRLFDGRTERALPCP